MMPNTGPPPLNFIVTSSTFTFASGLSIGLVYYYIRNLLPKQFWHRVTFFTDLMIGTSFIFFTLPVYLLFNLPFQLLLSWFISSFIILFLTSLTLVKIIKWYMYYLYLLRCSDNSLYCEQTKDLQRRIEEHNKERITPVSENLSFPQK